MSNNLKNAIVDLMNGKSTNFGNAIEIELASRTQDAIDVARIPIVSALFKDQGEDDAE